jgi:hypothetical protein
MPRPSVAANAMLGAGLVGSLGSSTASRGAVGERGEHAFCNGAGRANVTRVVRGLESRARPGAMAVPPCQRRGR